MNLKKRITQMQNKLINLIYILNIIFTYNNKKYIFRTKFVASTFFFIPKNVIFSIKTVNNKIKCIEENTTYGDPTSTKKEDAQLNVICAKRN